MSLLFYLRFELNIFLTSNTVIIWEIFFPQGVIL